MRRAVRTVVLARPWSARARHHSASRTDGDRNLTAARQSETDDGFSQKPQLAYSAFNCSLVPYE